MNAATNENKIDTIPKTWPGAFGAFKYSKQLVMFNLGSIIILLVTGQIISLLVNNIFGFRGSIIGVASIGFVFSFLISVYLQAALIITYFSSINNKKKEFIEAIKDVLPFYVNLLAMNIIRSLILGISFLALIIPFFIVLPRLMLAEYYLIDKKMDIIESLKASWNETRGHSLKVWMIIGTIIVMCLPMITIIGVILTIYLLVLYSAVYAVLYKYITSSK